jgi:hypothetical protein
MLAAITIVRTSHFLQVQANGRCELYFIFMIYFLAMSAVFRLTIKILITGRIIFSKFLFSTFIEVFRVEERREHK